MGAQGTPKYFVFPFGVNGNLTTIPDPTQVSGAVSYQIGFGPDYALASSNPSYLTIPRNQFNQLMFDITSCVQQLYQNGFPTFITSAMNGGSAYSYAQNAYVYQPANGNVYYSLIPNNTDTPPTSNWQLANGTSATSYYNAATDTGSTNHYVIAPSPAVIPAAGDIIILQPVNANTGACDINVNGAGAIAIKTLQNQDPAAGMLIPSGTYLLSYNTITGFWVVLNPALGTAAYVNTGTTNGTVPVLTSTGLPAVSGQNLTNLPAQFTVSNATNGYIKFGTVTIQWGISAASGSPRTITYPVAFSGNAYSVTLTFEGAQGAQTSVTLPSVTSVGASTFALNVCPNPTYWMAIGPT